MWTDGAVGKNEKLVGSGGVAGMSGTVMFIDNAIIDNAVYDAAFAIGPLNASAALAGAYFEAGSVFRENGPAAQSF